MDDVPLGTRVRHAVSGHAAGIFGNGHTLALEKNNVAIMERMIAWLERHVYG